MCLSNLSNRAFRSSLSLMTFDSSGSSEVKFCKGEIQYMYKEYWNSVENFHKCYPIFCLIQKLHKQITFGILYPNNWCMLDAFNFFNVEIKYVYVHLVAIFKNENGYIKMATKTDNNINSGTDLGRSGSSRGRWLPDSLQDFVLLLVVVSLLLHHPNYCLILSNRL